MRPHPSHTTVRTGPYTAVRRVELTANRQSRKSQPVEVNIGQCDSKRRTVGEPPRTVSAARRLRGQVSTHSPFRQLPKPHRPSPPLLPHRGSQPASDPPLKAFQHARRVALPEIAKPTPQIAGQLLHHSFRAHPARPTRQLPHPLLKAFDRLGCYPPFRLSSAREAEAQKLSLPWPPQRALFAGSPAT